MNLLIVNADDCGLTEQVNRGIADAHRRGLVTSTSLLANGAAFDSAVALTRTVPTLGAGIHLNLTEGRPISPATEIPGLVDADGLFDGTPARLVRKLLAGAAPLAQIERELRAQIERVLAAGITPTHLDGHQHVQTWPSIFAIAMKLALEYRIRGIRCSAERPVNLVGMMKTHPQSSAPIVKQYVVGRALALLARGQRRRARQAGLACPDHFYGVTQTGFLDGSTLESILRDTRQGSRELMCHPGYVDRDLHGMPTRLQDQRAVELEALTQPAMRRLADRLGLRLGTYRELQGSGA